MQTRIDTKHARYSFDSLHEMAQWIAQTPCRWRCQKSVTNDYGMSWDFDVGYQGAIRLARDGWIEGAERAQEALKHFPAKTPAPDTKIDFYGFRPHVARFCAGAPDSMIRHARDAEHGSGRVLTIYVPLFISAMRDAKYVANFGIAVAQYVNQLEADGWRVEVHGSFIQTHKSGWRTAFTFNIKHADQPLDLAVLAFAVGHPAMFRRIGFALQERSEAPTDTAYGYPTTPTAGDLINPPPGFYILDGINDAPCKTPEAALEYVSKQIEKAMEAQEL